MVTSVIVHYFNFMRLAVPPDEADPPPIVDPNAVLSSSISLERFEMVARWNAKILHPPGSMKVEELAACDAFHRPEPKYRSILKERLGVAASKRTDQSPVYDVLGIPSSRIQCGCWCDSVCAHL